MSATHSQLQPQSIKRIGAQKGPMLPGWDKLVGSLEQASPGVNGKQQASNGDGMVCDFCRTVVQYVKIALDSNQTVAQVRGASSTCDNVH